MDSIPAGVLCQTCENLEGDKEEMKEETIEISQKNKTEIGK